MGFFTSLFDFVKTASPYIESGAGIAKDAYGVYSAYSASKDAEAQADVQRAEIERNRMLSEAAARKEARVKKARLLSSGITSSTVSMGVVGIQSSLESGLTDLSQRTSFNVDTLGYQEQAVKDQVLLSGIGSFTSAAAGTKEFSDLLVSNTEAVQGDLYNVPSGSFESRG